MLKQDIRYMQLAIEQAKIAEKHGEVPVGAIIVLEHRTDKYVFTGFNQTVSTNDPTAHAEIVAIKQACLNRQNYRLPNSTLYVTLEPCIMCAGAILQARIDRVVFGSIEMRTGSLCTHLNALDGMFMHKSQVVGGVLVDECRSLIQQFFIKKRKLTSID